MYNNDSNSLNAGAPDIRLTGNRDPNTQMASQPDPTAEMNDFSMKVFGKPLHQLTPPQLDALYELMNEQSQAPQQNSGIMASGPGTYTQQRKQMMAGGGIAGLKQIGKPGGLVEPGISKYGMFDFITDPIKSVYEKFVDDIIPNEIKENPVATAALIGGGINQFGLPDFLTKSMGMGSDVGQNWLGNLLGAVIPGDAAIDTVFGKEGVGYTLPELIQGMPGQGTGIAGMDDAGLNPNWAAKLAADVASGTLSAANLPDSLKGIVAQQINKQIPGLNLQTPNQAQAGFDYKKLAIPLSIGAGVGKYVSGLPKDTLPMDTTSIDPAAIAAAARGTDAEGIAAGLRFLPEQVTRAAQGGRIGAQEGGLMDLGGMEKDYRQEGGFVPIGGKEKADDVPARLSKNEFVFTADAVRAAGGGDIDQGAEVMENMMKNLEAGGEVSEDSQGLEGARGMFANAQQLQKRII